MITIFAHLLRALLPVALITGAILALWQPENQTRRLMPQLVWAIAAGLLIGLVSSLAAFQQAVVTEIRATLHLVTLLMIWSSVAGVLLNWVKPAIARAVFKNAAIALLSSLTALGSFEFSLYLAEQWILTTSVLSSELITHSFAMLMGLAISGLLIPLTAHLSRKTGQGLARAFFMAICALLTISLGARLLVGAMQLQLLKVHSTVLSAVARVEGFSYAFVYMQLAALAVLAGVFIVKSRAGEPRLLAETTGVQRRKTMHSIIVERRWARALVLTLVFLVTSLAYFDLYASQPLQISTPTPIAPDAKGLIRIPIADVQNGRLHRFSWTTAKGLVARFLMINRYQNQIKIGVVFDACGVCGDTGYVQQDNQIICIACNVRIFIPSIGKPGGCNPIPLAHEVKDGHVVIKAEELVRGSRYFSAG